MNQEAGGAGGGFASVSDWSSLAKAIRGAASSEERSHWISEYAGRVGTLPESERPQRLDSLARLVREAR